jgi:hypothetical protein
VRSEDLVLQLVGLEDLVGSWLDGVGVLAQLLEMVFLQLMGLEVLQLMGLEEKELDQLIPAARFSHGAVR